MTLFAPHVLFHVNCSSCSSCSGISINFRATLCRSLTKHEWRFKLMINDNSRKQKTYAIVLIIHTLRIIIIDSEMSHTFTVTSNSSDSCRVPTIIAPVRLWVPWSDRWVNDVRISSNRGTMQCSFSVWPDLIIHARRVRFVGWYPFRVRSCAYSSARTQEMRGRYSNSEHHCSSHKFDLPPTTYHYAVLVNFLTLRTLYVVFRTKVILFFTEPLVLEVAF